MGGIGELIIGLFPLLLSGAVVGAMLSYLTPMLVKKLKTNLTHNKILQMYDRYKRNPEGFGRVKPELFAFFESNGWHTCECDNCVWFRKKFKIDKSDKPDKVESEKLEVKVDKNK